jgi:hypothetical protein
VGYYSDYVDEEHIYDRYSSVPKMHHTLFVGGKKAHDNIDTTVFEPLRMTCTENKTEPRSF